MDTSIDDVRIRSITSLEEYGKVLDELAKIFVSSQYDYYAMRAHLECFDDCDPAYSLEQSRVAVVDGRVVSHVRLLDRTAVIGDARIRFGGFRCVCTLPAFRKQGLAKKLIKDSLAWLRASGYPMALLHGIQGVYRRLGFSPATAHYHATVGVKDLPEAPVAAKLEPATTDDLRSIAEIYKANHTGRALYLERSREHWEGLFKRFTPSVDQDDKDVFVARDSVGRVLGYAFFRGLELKEAGFDTDEAARAIVAELGRRHRAADEKEATIAMPPRSPIVSFLERYGITNRQQHFRDAGWMAQFLDPLAVFKAMAPEFERLISLSELASSSALVEIRTEDLPIGIEVRKGRVIVRGEPGGTPQATLMCTNRDLVPLITGYRTVETLRYAHTEGETRYLDVLFPERQPFMEQPDHF